MKFLAELKGKGNPVLSTKAPATAYGLPRQGSRYRDDWDIDRTIDRGLRASIWGFRAVHAIADAQARLPFEVRRGSEKGEVILDHDLVRLLNQKPNGDEQPYGFRYRLSSTMLVSRTGAYVELIPNRVGGIAEVRLLDPRKIKPILADGMDVAVRALQGKSTRVIRAYEVDLGGGQKIEIPAERVLNFRLPHPIDPFSGMTPFEPAGLSLEIDVLARLYNRSFLQNDGRPGGIVGVKGDLDDETADFLEDRFNSGARGAGRVTILEADGLDWVDTATSPRDAQYSESRTQTKEDILGAFGVPESIALGNASQRTFENVDAEREIFWDPTMVGHLQLLADAWNQADDDETTFCTFDLSDVEPLQRVALKRREEMRAEVAAGLRSIDSYREAIGLEALNTADTSGLLLPMGLVPVGVPTGSKSLMIDAVAREIGRKAIAEIEGEVVTPFRRRLPGPA